MKNSSLLYFIGALVLFIIIVVLNIFWYSAVSSEAAQSASLAAQIEAKADDSTRAAQAKTELTALSSDQAAIQQYFVSTNDVVPFLQELQSTGNYLGSNVQIVSVSATPGTPYGQLALSLSIAGSFNSVMRTLGSIEYGPYDSEISTLSLEIPNGTSGSSSSQWTANAVFTVGTETDTSIPAPAVASTTPVTSVTPPTTTAPPASTGASITP